MAGLKNACYGFAYHVESKGGDYVLNITDAAAVLVCNKMTGGCDVHLDRCAPICSDCSNLPYAKICVTVPIAEDGLEPMIMRIQFGPKDSEVIWIRKDGPNHC